MREINSEEVYMLKECLVSLADYHNSVSINFKGHYPKESFDETLNRFSADLSKGKSLIAVIEDGDKVIGFCKINYDLAVGVLEYLVVVEDYRGKGHGTRLLDWAINKFDELGICNVDVKVADGNEATTLYEKYGFKMNAHILRLCR